MLHGPMGGNKKTSKTTKKVHILARGVKSLRLSDPLARCSVRQSDIFQSPATEQKTKHCHEFMNVVAFAFLCLQINFPE